MSWLMADDDTGWSNSEFVSALGEVAMQPYHRVTSGPPLTALMFGEHEDFTAAVRSARAGPQFTTEELAAWGLMGMVPGFTMAAIGSYLADFALWRHPAVIAVTAPAASANIVYEVSQALDAQSNDPNVKHGPSLMNYWAKSGSMSGSSMPVIWEKWW